MVAMRCPKCAQSGRERDAVALPRRSERHAPQRMSWRELPKAIVKGRAKPARRESGALELLGEVKALGARERLGQSRAPGPASTSATRSKPSPGDNGGGWGWAGTGRPGRAIASK